MKLKPVSMLVLLALSMFAGLLYVVPSTQPASALPIVQVTAGGNCSSASPDGISACSVTFATTPVVGDYIIFVWTATNESVSSLTGAISESWEVGSPSSVIGGIQSTSITGNGYWMDVSTLLVSSSMMANQLKVGGEQLQLLINPTIPSSIPSYVNQLDLWGFEVNSGLDGGNIVSGSDSGTSVSVYGSDLGALHLPSSDTGAIWLGGLDSAHNSASSGSADFAKNASFSATVFDSDGGSSGPSGDVYYYTTGVQYSDSFNGDDTTNVHMNGNITGTTADYYEWAVGIGVSTPMYPVGIGHMDGVASPTYPTKDMTFLADGLTWAFYANGTSGGYVCSTSSNLGFSWTTPKELYLPFGSPGGQQAWSSYYYRATNTLVYVFSDNSLVYRSMQLSSGGCASISYNAAYQELDFVPYWGSSSGPNYASITVDSSGHPWIEFEMTTIGGHAAQSCGAGVCRMVVEGSDVVTAGTFTITTGPVKMFTTPSSMESNLQTAEILPTGSGVTFLAANGSSEKIFARTDTISGWGSAVGTSGTVTAGCTGMSPPCAFTGYYAWSAMQDAVGNVHIVYLGSDSFLHYTIFYPGNNSMRADFKLNGGSTFADIGYAYPAIDINGSNVYVFWADQNQTYYQAEIAGVWGGATTFFTDAFQRATPGAAYMPQISSRSQDFIGGIYTIDSEMKFFYLAPAPSSNVTVCVKYSLIGGGSYNPPVLTYLRVNGSSAMLTLKYTLTCITTKTGDTYSITDPLTGISASGQERGFTQNLTSSTFPSSRDYDFLYWHQLFVPVSYTITDGVATNHPTLTYTVFGGVVTITNEKYATSYWMDYNSHWTAQSPFITSPDFVTLTGHPPSGQSASLQPVIIAYYAASSCGGANPLTEIENLCLIPGIVDAWSYGIGVAPWLGFVLLGINVAIYNKSQNVWISLLVLWVSGAVFSAALPAYISQVAQIFLYLGIAGLAVKTILLSR